MSLAELAPSAPAYQELTTVDKIPKESIATATPTIVKRDLIGYRNKFLKANLNDTIPTDFQSSLLKMDDCFSPGSSFWVVSNHHNRASKFSISFSK